MSMCLNRLIVHVCNTSCLHSILQYPPDIATIRAPRRNTHKNVWYRDSENTDDTALHNATATLYHGEYYFIISSSRATDFDTKYKEK